MKKYTEIDGWFNFENVYTFLLSTIKDEGIFVECGAWLGKSSAFLCDYAQKNTSIFIVDHWLGSPEERDSTHSLAKNCDIYDIFISNMGSRRFTPIRKNSIEASKLFLENSCDIVFIDMDHTYEAVKNDIEAWLPKIKKGGYLAGHDYNQYWSGVVRAVDEIFGSNKIINGDCWIYYNE